MVFDEPATFARVFHVIVLEATAWQSQLYSIQNESNRYCDEGVKVLQSETLVSVQRRFRGMDCVMVIRRKEVCLRTHEQRKSGFVYIKVWTWPRASRHHDDDHGSD